MQKLVLLLAIIGILTACSTKENSTSKKLRVPSEGYSTQTRQLHQEKVAIDTLLSQNPKQVTVLVKIPDRDALVEVVDEKWPEEIETTYNILRDAAGRIIYIYESPFSESGDWDTNYHHYFHEDGKTFAYAREVRAFNTFCPEDEYLDELTIEKMTKIFSPAYVLLDSTYSMTDGQGKNITKKKCQQEVNTENEVFKDVQKYLEARKIEIR